MGIGGIHIWNLLILLLVVILLFGTNKLRNIGADLGNAIKGFRNAMREGHDAASPASPPSSPSSPNAPAPADKPAPAEPSAATEAGRVIEGQVTARDAPKA